MQRGDKIGALKPIDAKRVAGGEKGGSNRRSWLAAACNGGEPEWEMVAWVDRGEKPLLRLVGNMIVVAGGRSKVATEACKRRRVEGSTRTSCWKRLQWDHTTHFMCPVDILNTHHQNMIRHAL